MSSFKIQYNISPIQSVADFNSAKNGPLYYNDAKAVLGIATFFYTFFRPNGALVKEAGIVAGGITIDSIIEYRYL